MISFKDYLLEKTCNCWDGYKRKPGTKPCAPGSCVKESVELDESMTDSWKKVQSMDKGSVTGGPDEVKKRLTYLHAVHDHHKKFGNDTKKVKGDIERINRSGIAEGATGAKPGWMLRQDPALAKKLKDQKARSKFVAGVPTKKPVQEETVIDEAAVDAKGHKSSTGGLTQKGRDAYNAKGAKLQAPVTTPPSKLDPDSKAAKRRKSFCARMSGVDGPMKKPNGEPTRKALALRKWNC